MGNPGGVPDQPNIVMEPKIYKKLPGRRSAFVGFASNTLWLAEDHVLHVIQRGYTEEYRRFYFQDVQAFTLYKTAVGRILAVILGTLAACSGILLFLGWRIWNWGDVALSIWGINFVFWLLVFLIHIVRGETCSCRIQTAVQMEPLPSLNRLRNAERFLRILTERAETMQGLVSDESLSGLSEAQQLTPDAISPEIQSDEVHQFRSNAHLILFSLLVLDGLRLAANLLNTRLFLYEAGLVIYVASLALVILALIRQRQTNLPGLVKGLVWCTLVFLWTSAAAWYFYGIFMSIERPDAGLNYWALMKSIAEKQVMESVPLLIFHSFSAFCSFAFGITGFIALGNFYNKKRLAQ